MEPLRALELVLGQPEHGWLPVRVTIGDEVFEYKASNVMNDTLAEIAEVALALDDGGAVNECVRVWEEPETKELQFEAHEDSLSVHFSIYDADRRERIVSAMIERGVVRDALANALLSLEPMSKSDRLEGWGRFPAQALQRLVAPSR